MKKNVLKILLTFIAIILFLFSYNYLITDKSKAKKNAAALRNEYPLLNEYFKEKKIQGIIKSKELSTNQYYKGGYLLELENGIKFSLYGASRNYIYNESDLNRFLKINDSIFKSVNSDSIFVYRNSNEYYFILNKIINEK